MNGVIPFNLAYLLDCPVFDCNVMCRAFPEYGMSLPNIYSDPGLPLV